MYILTDTLLVGVSFNITDTLLVGFPPNPN